MNILFKELSENHESANQDLTAKSLQDYVDHHRACSGAVKSNGGNLVMSTMAMAGVLSSSSIHQALLLSAEEARQFKAILSSATAKLTLLTTRPPIESKLYQALRNSPEGEDDVAGMLPDVPDEPIF